MLRYRNWYQPLHLAVPKGLAIPQLMRERLSQKGFISFVEPLLSTEEGPICSTNIRKAIEDRAYGQAAACFDVHTVWRYHQC